MSMWSDHEVGALSDWEFEQEGIRLNNRDKWEQEHEYDGLEDGNEMKIHPDGTLEVEVPDIDAVNRVLVTEEGTKYCKLMYPEEERSEDEVDRR